MDPQDAARTLVAHLFQRSGRKTLSESELANAASLDLSWYPPKQARELVAGLVRAGHLERTADGDLLPRFDIRAIRVPLSFRPPKDLPASLPPPGAVAPSGVSGRAEQDQPRSSEAASADTATDTDSDVCDLGAMLQGLADRTDEDVSDWVQRMERVVQETGDLLTPEAALLLAASIEGQDVAGPARQYMGRLGNPA